MITLPFGVLWSVLYVVYVDGCLLALVTGVLELVYLQPLALRKNVHQSWPPAVDYSDFFVIAFSAQLKIHFRIVSRSHFLPN